MDQKKQVVCWLFESGALKVSPAERPFWYTSGKFGPYYVNTHYLFGGEEDAKQLLATIDSTRDCPLAMSHIVAKLIQQQLGQSGIYRQVVDYMLASVAELDFDLISGGERRDFFFSIPLALLLGKDHLSILKDGRSFLCNQGISQCKELKANELQGRRVLHVADLVTEASSYFRSWLPAIETAGGRISDTYAVIDRCQGGREALAGRDLKLHTATAIDPPFFDLAEEAGMISADQKRQLLRFLENPDQYMHHFLGEHPGFLDAEEFRDPRTAERVSRCRELGFH